MPPWFLDRAREMPRWWQAETGPAERPARRDPVLDPDWAWIPEADANGHPLGPGAVSFSFVMCQGCPATLDGRGHFVVGCRVIGCDAPPIPPPEHLGPVQHRHCDGRRG